MGDRSAIEWTEATWNPVVGCSKVSPGCARCYAEELHRTRLDGRGAYPSFEPWTPANAEHNVTLVPERLDQPLRWREPRMIFVNSMSDLFHELLPWKFVAEVFAVMSIAERHTFQVLTKRPGLMRALLTHPMFWLHLNSERMRHGVSVLPGGMSDTWPSGERTLPNVWLGTSIENRRFIGRADDLRATPAAVRFISAEPLLGPLVASERVPVPGFVPRSGSILQSAWYAAWPDGVTIADRPQLNLTGIDWLIVGGESGRNARPMRPEWVRDLRAAALTRCYSEAEALDPCGGTVEYLPDGSPLAIPPVRYRTAFFFKQWGGRTPKAGGRELDGRTWDEMPEAVAA